MRTPVASKNAFATAEPTAAVGGSPDPDRFHPALNAAVLPLLTSVVRLPGTTVTYSPGGTLISVTDGESLNRRIGYVTQSVLVIRSFVNVSCSYRARERP